MRVVLVEPGGFKTRIWGEAVADVARRTGSHYTSAYRRSMQGVRLTEPIMGSPRRVANVVARAVTGRIVLPRYLVGVDARALAVAEQLTPTMVKDLAMRLGLGL